MPVDTSKWQPIETAPKDGSPFLAWVLNTHMVVFFAQRSQDSYCWQTDDDCGIRYHCDAATHWMPLPEPPADLQLADPAS